MWDSWPIGAALSADGEMATWYRWLWSAGRGAALLAVVGLGVSHRSGGPLFSPFPFYRTARTSCVSSPAVLGHLDQGCAELRVDGVLRSSYGQTSITYSESLCLRAVVNGKE